MPRETYTWIPEDRSGRNTDDQRRIINAHTISFTWINQDGAEITNNGNYILNNHSYENKAKITSHQQTYRVKKRFSKPKPKGKPLSEEGVSTCSNTALQTERVSGVEVGSALRQAPGGTGDVSSQRQQDGGKSDKYGDLFLKDNQHGPQELLSGEFNINDGTEMQLEEITAEHESVDDWIFSSGNANTESTEGASTELFPYSFLPVTTNQHGSNLGWTDWSPFDQGKWPQNQ